MPAEVNDSNTVGTGQTMCEMTRGNGRTYGECIQTGIQFLFEFEARQHCAAKICVFHQQVVPLMWLILIITLRILSLSKNM